MAAKRFNIAMNPILPESGKKLALATKFANCIIVYRGTPSTRILPSNHSPDCVRNWKARRQFLITGIGREGVDLNLRDNDSIWRNAPKSCLSAAHNLSVVRTLLVACEKLPFVQFLFFGPKTDCQLSSLCSATYWGKLSQMFQLVFRHVGCHRKQVGSEDSQTIEPVAPEVQARGQRTFLAEVGIIILGVLVALFIGEAATAVRQRVDAQRSMEAIRADMIDNSSQFELTLLLNSCADRRLDVISAEIAKARLSGILPDVGDLGVWGGSTARTGAWESAVANQNILFLDKERVAKLTDYHEGLEFYQTFQNDAALNWARLTVLTHAPGCISDDTLAFVSQAIAEIRHQNRYTTLLANVLLQTHNELGFPVEYTPMNGKPTNKKDTIRSIKTLPNCQPLQITQ